MTTPRVTHSTEAGRTVVRIAGELDFASVGFVTEELERALAESRELLIVDLSATTFLDSAGVKLLYELHAVMRARNTEMQLIVPPGNLIHRTLVLADADGSLPIRPRPGDAPGGEAG